MKRYAFVLITVLFALMPVRSALRADAPHYTVEDLGTLGGAVPTVTGINASGQVSGFVTLADHSTRAVRYTPGNGWQLLKDLDTRSGAANGINASGDLVGQYITAGGFMHAFRWRDGSGLEDIAPIGGTNSQGFGINDNGVVVGVSSTSGSDIVGFVAAPGLPAQALPTMGGGFDFACGINNAGQIAGSGFTSDFIQRAYRFDPGASALTPISSFIGDAGNSAACAIDASGLVGGQADGPANTMHGFRSGATLLNLTEVFGTNTGSTDAISEGVSVGAFKAADNQNHAFVHTDAKGSIDLNTVLDNGTGWVLKTANGVNASGKIVGTGTLNGAAAVFLLTRVDTEADTTAPLISSFTASPNTIAPPNNATVPVQFFFNATDNIDPSPSCSVNSTVNTNGAPSSYASVTGPLAVILGGSDKGARDSERDRMPAPCGPALERALAGGTSADLDWPGADGKSTPSDPR